MNKNRLYKTGLVLSLVGLVVGSYKFGYLVGSRINYFGSVINTMAKIQYALAYREGFLRGADVACGANKHFEGPDFDQLHPSPDSEGAE